MERIVDASGWGSYDTVAGYVDGAFRQAEMYGEGALETVGNASQLNSEILARLIDRLEAKGVIDLRDVGIICRGYDVGLKREGDDD